MDSRKAISLFSGSMGLELGLIQAGVDICLCVDSDPACVGAIQRNGYKALEADVRSLDASSLLWDAEIVDPRDLFLVCASLPDWGREEGDLEPVRAVVRLLSELKPRFFLLDCSQEMANQHSPGLDELLAPLKEAGEEACCFVLNAANYGAALFQARYIVMGSMRHQDELFLPVKTHYSRHQNRQNLWRTLQDNIEDLERRPGPGASFDCLYSGRRTLSYDRPAPFLLPDPLDAGGAMCHPIRNRPLSVQEYARIAGFPDHWSFPGELSDQYASIASATAVPLGLALGQTFLTAASPHSVFGG